MQRYRVKQKSFYPEITGGSIKPFRRPPLRPDDDDAPGGRRGGGRRPVVRLALDDTGRADVYRPDWRPGTRRAGSPAPDVRPRAAIRGGVPLVFAPLGVVLEMVLASATT
jgi:hypothetical protein